MRNNSIFSKKIDKFLIVPKWMKLLVLIKKFPNSYPMEINKKISSSSEYSHTFIIAQTISKLGLIDFEKHGRVQLMNLTEAGKQLANVCDGIVSVLYNGDNSDILSHLKK